MAFTTYSIYNIFKNKTMTVKQYSVLKQYETQMLSAVNGNYARALGSQSREKLAVVYKEIFKRDSGFIGGCGSCILKNLKELATPYFEFQEKLKHRNNNTPNTPENGTEG